MHWYLRGPNKPSQKTVEGRVHYQEQNVYPQLTEAANLNSEHTRTLGYAIIFIASPPSAYL